MKTVRFLFAAMVCMVLLTGSLVEAGDKPTFDYKLYGYFKLDGSYDQNTTSHGNFVMWVNPQTTTDNDAQYNMTANQTRFGIKVNSKDYEQLNFFGNLEFDLYGGVTGATVAQNKALLVTRHAYFSIQTGNTKVLAGQTWDMVSPLHAPTLNYPVLWGCGNLGYRRPQISLWQKVNFESGGELTLAGGFFRTIGNDLTPTVNITLATAATDTIPDGQDDGTNSAIPSFQGLIDYKHKFQSGTSIRFGCSGLWGQLKAENSSRNTSENYESWAAAGHFWVSVPSGWGLSGEVYSGQNLGVYNGGINNGSTLTGVASLGFWGATWFKPMPTWQFTTGYGMDDPEDADLAAGARCHNSCIFGNVKYFIIPQAYVGLEVSQWQTEYKGTADKAKNLRLQSSFQMSF
ncbi:MAG: hypothetical protein GY855_11120 [candidate division Zixibacteria bacterium]|nr:hypothetical protein [candidate division Zixibacteria bacterium]